MKTKPLVLLCWVQVVVVAAFLAIVFYNNFTRPSMQFDYPEIRDGTLELRFSPGVQGYAFTFG